MFKEKDMRILAMCVVAAMLGGCIGIGDSSQTTPPTVGQQLVDLKTARDRGAISEQEYEQKKAEILRNKP